MKGKSGAGAETGKTAAGMPIEDPAFDQGLRRMRPGKIGKVVIMGLFLVVVGVLLFLLFRLPLLLLLWGACGSRCSVVVDDDDDGGGGGGVDMSLLSLRLLLLLLVVIVLLAISLQFASKTRTL